MENKKMKTIYKYLLEITDRQVVNLPAGAQIRSVDNQQGHLYLWAEVNSDEKETVKHEILIVGTGHPLPECSKLFLGTVVIEPFVWHVYEVTNSRKPMDMSRAILGKPVVDETGTIVGRVMEVFLSE